MGNFRGIVLYNIELDGNLNGVYTSNHPEMRARIFTETARLRDNTLIENKTEVHIYDSFYFDAVDGRVNCTLTFRITNGIYNAEWVLENGFIFVGQGFQMNERQIAVSYWFNT